ncbi:MAG: ferredoxin family protein [Tannerella sp.]|jgi:NAD-dependent dihydropyrimidine dehydrogenase PreA subunit|nr:ferredoxin family protein [Tannerella sp.]
MQNTRVTVCACVSRSFIDREKVVEIAVALNKKGYQVKIEADLCRKVMEASPEMRQIAQGIIIACYPRAVRSHLDWLGLTAEHIMDIRNNNSKEVLSHFDIFIPASHDMQQDRILRQEIETYPVENGTDAWYPVLDKTRCTDCGKCHDFCLFGVYARKDKQVRVVKPQNCKNNCPACARICPSKAIIFPKYDKSPVNGGLQDEESFNPHEMDAMYRERLRYKLQQRRAGISLLKRNQE